MRQEPSRMESNTHKTEPFRRRRVTRARRQHGERTGPIQPWWTRTCMHSTLCIRTSSDCASAPALALTPVPVQRVASLSPPSRPVLPFPLPPRPLPPQHVITPARCGLVCRHPLNIRKRSRGRSRTSWRTTHRGSGRRPSCSALRRFWRSCPSSSRTTSRPSCS